jgi:prefoldin subunit 5
MRKSQINRAIELLQIQAADLDARTAGINQAIQALRSTQTEQPTRIAKPRAVAPAEKAS